MMAGRLNILFLVAVFCVGVPCVGYGQEWGWKEIGKGVQLGEMQGEMFGARQSISVLRYKAGRCRMDIVNDPAEIADSTSAFGERYKAIAAINGSYFDVRNLTPATFVKDDGALEGVTLPSESYRTDGIVAVKGRRKVEVIPCDSVACVNLSKQFREVLASGPMLIADGAPAKEEWPEDSFFSGRHPRTLLGTTKDGWVYLIVIDGRAWGNAAGATIREAVQIAQMFGLDYAINLDGGGSSTLWTERFGVVSHPCDNRKYDHSGQRKVPNAILIR